MSPTDFAPNHISKNTSFVSLRCVYQITWARPDFSCSGAQFLTLRMASVLHGTKRHSQTQRPCGTTKPTTSQSPSTLRTSLLISSSFPVHMKSLKSHLIVQPSSLYHRSLKFDLRPSSNRPTTTMSTTIRANATSNGDLNNTGAARSSVRIEPDAAYLRHSLAISECDDEPKIRRKYRPFLLDPNMDDWVSKLELSTTMKMAEQDLMRSGDRLKVLVLFGSLRRRLVATRPSRTYSTMLI